MGANEYNDAQKELIVSFLSEMSSDKGKRLLRASLETKPKMARKLLRDWDILDKVLENPLNNDKYRRKYKSAINLSAIEAMEEDNLARLAALKGVTKSSGGDVIDADGYSQLINDMFPNGGGRISMVKGGMGWGKTISTISIIIQALERGKVDNVILNIKTAGFDNSYDIDIPERYRDRIHFETKFSEILMRIKEGNPAENNVVLTDEMSSILNELGGSKDAKMIVKRFVHALRKSGYHWVNIAHLHDTDILSLVRNQTDVVIEKQGRRNNLLDKARVWKTDETSGKETKVGWSKYEQGDEPDYIVHKLQDVDEDNPLYVADEHFASIQFDLDDPENQIQDGQIIDGWEQYQDNADDEEESEEQVVRDCPVVLKSEDSRVEAGSQPAGRPCGSPTRTSVCNMCEHEYDEDYLDNYR